MATTSKVKKVIYSSLFGLGLTAGGVTLASAATTQEKPPTTIEAPGNKTDTESTDSKATEHDEADEKPDYTSSVTVPVTKEGPEGSDADEAKADRAEQAKLEKVAKIDAKAASKAATDKVPGTVDEIDLDEEGGNVVYEVEVTAKDGTETDVIVDAGNGKILAQETDDRQPSPTTRATTPMTRPSRPSLRRPPRSTPRQRRRPPPTKCPAPSMKPTWTRSTARWSTRLK